jgi:hypothetical protein
MYCKHCEKELDANIKSHNCEKKGLLLVDEDDSFLVSALIGYGTDSALLGGFLGGDLLGGIVGDMLDGDLFD